MLIRLVGCSNISAFNALEKHGRESVFLRNRYYFKISKSRQFEIQRSSAICSSGAGISAMAYRCKSYKLLYSQAVCSPSVQTLVVEMKQC